MVTWESFLFEKDIFYDIVHVCGIWLFFPFYHNLFLFFMFLYLSFIYLLFKYLEERIVNEMKSWLIKKSFVVETLLDLIYILPYYFYLVHVKYYFYLFFSCCQPWLWPLVNTSLISQFEENTSCFNYLANALW